MKRAALLVGLIFTLSFSSLNGQDTLHSIFTPNEIGLATSFNAVTDEVIWGVEIHALKDLVRFKYWKVYGGASMFYGAFPNTNAGINQHLEGTTSFWQPIQLLIGQHFLLFKSRLQFRAAISLGPSWLRQSISLNDDRFDFNENKTYSNFFFTGHIKAGTAVRIGKKYSLELFANLPVVKSHVAPWGLGIGVNRTF